jgi:hypothetical protein
MRKNNDSCIIIWNLLIINYSVLIVNYNLRIKKCVKKIMIKEKNKIIYHG